MRKKNLKPVSLLLALIVFASVFSLGSLPSFAASDIALTYDLNVDGENTAYAEAPGDIVAVSFTIRREDAQSEYSLFSMQNEIEYDMNFFEFVSAEAVHTASYNGVVSRPEMLHQTRTTGQNIVKATIMTANDIYAPEEVFCTVNLRVRTDKGLSDGDSGWVRSSEAKAHERDIDACTVDTEDLTVFIGRAPEVSYSLRLELNGGSWETAADDISGTYASGARVALPTPRRSGYSFDGWYNGANRVQGTSFSVNGNTTLTAHWLGIRTISFNMNGGSQLAPISATENESITLPGSAEARRTGYVLSYWESTNGTRYEPGASYTVSGDAALSAVWEDHSAAHATLPAASKIYGSASVISHTHIEGSSPARHNTQYAYSVSCAICGAALENELRTAAEACVGVQYSDGRNSVSNWVLSADGTRRWHECIYCGRFDEEAVPTGGGSGGGGGGFNGGGSGDSGSSETDETLVSIQEGEVPLAAGDLIVTAELVEKAAGITASASRNNDGSVEVSVLDAEGNRLDSVSGGVKVSVHGIKDGQVAAIIDSETGEILDLLEKSIVEDAIAYTLVGGSCTIIILDNAKPFDDVSPEKWFNGAVVFASSHELFQGIEERIFAPNMNITRGMLVTVLWRLENKPEDFASGSFPDVAEDTWYTEAVSWASKNGIVLGYDDGSFKPNQSITRQEMAAMLYRYMDFLGYDMSARGDLSSFSDAAEVSAWALENVEWANGAGIIMGNDLNEISPKGFATRAEVATMFMRIVDNMVR